MKQTITRFLFLAALIFLMWEAVTAPNPFDGSRYVSLTTSPPGDECVSSLTAMPDLIESGKNYLERMLGRSRINGIQIADDRLIRPSKTVSEEAMERNRSFLNQISSREENVYLMILPTASSVYLQQDAQHQEALQKMRDLTFLTAFDPRQYLSIQSDKPIFYRTMDAMTSLGGYYAYLSIGRTLGFQPLTLDRFNVRYGTDTVQGELCALTGNYDIKGDSCFYYYDLNCEIRWASLVNETGTYLWGERLFEQLLRLRSSGGSIWSLEIESSAPGNSLLLIADSDGLELLPFLCEHYRNITVVSTDCSRRLALNKIDRSYSKVLVAVREDSLIEHPMFRNFDVLFEESTQTD